MTDDFSILFEDLPQTQKIPEPEPYPEITIQAPTQRLTVKGMSVGYLILFIILAIVCLVGAVVAIGYLAIGLASGVIIIDFDLIYIILVVVALFPISIISIIKIIRKKSLEIGPEGIAFKIKGTVDFEASWDEISQIFTIPAAQQSLPALGIIKKNGMAMKVSTMGIAGSKLKQGFQLMKSYCEYHLIRVDNQAKW